MKKYLNISFIYMIAAICAGVFHREFTKIMAFTGKTTLGVVHTHLFMLGMIMFLLIALYVDRLNLTGNKKFGRAMLLYNIGVPFAAVMMTARGILQVTSAELSRGLDMSISGVTGIAHIIITIALVFLFLGLREAADRVEVKSV